MVSQIIAFMVKILLHLWLIFITFIVGITFVVDDYITPNIVVPTMLGVVACVLALVCKPMQKFPTMLGPAMHRGKDTTDKSL